MVVRMIFMAIWTTTMVFLITMVGGDQGATGGVEGEVVVEGPAVHAVLGAGRHNGPVGQTGVLLTSG